MDEKYYTINQIAEKFGVTRTAVYDWMNTGRLNYVIVGQRRRISQAQLDAFILLGTKGNEGFSEKNAAPGLIAA